MREFITADGSMTFYNEEVQDHYHTKSGAREEAIEKYAKAMDIRPGRIVFDICFGLGYSSAAALDVGPATIYCFENDKEILKKILEIDADFKSYAVIKEFVRQFLEGNPVYEKDGIKLVMVFGDARELINTVPVLADYVFFAPFSPKMVPDMWTEQFFKDIRAKMRSGAKLGTYSYAVWVRRNMKNAGFTLYDGPTIGRISPSTIAVNE